MFFIKKTRLINHNIPSSGVTNKKRNKTTTFPTTFLNPIYILFAFRQEFSFFNQLNNRQKVFKLGKMSNNIFTFFIEKGATNNVFDRASTRGERSLS